MAFLRSSVVALLLLAVVSQTHAQATCNTNLLEAVLGTPELSLLATVVNASGLASTVAGLTNRTVIAPNNNAFNGTGGLLQILSDNGLTLEDVTADGSNRAASILLYHVIPVPALAAALTDGQVLPTLLGAGYNLTVSKAGSGVTIVGKANNATVVQADVTVCTSVVHIVNRVLLPEATLTAIPIYNTTAASPTMSPAESPVTPSPPAAGTPPGGDDGGNATTPTGAASTLTAGSLVFGLSGAVAAALLI